jgi:hypothetical protein
MWTICMKREHLVGNDVDTLHEKRIHLVGFSFIRVYDKWLMCAPIVRLRNVEDELPCL